MFCFWPLHLIAPALLLQPSLPLFAPTLVGEPLRAEGSEVPPFPMEVTLFPQLANWHRWNVCVRSSSASFPFFNSSSMTTFASVPTLLSFCSPLLFAELAELLQNMLHLLLLRRMLPLQSAHFAGSSSGLSTTCGCC